MEDIFNEPFFPIYFVSQVNRVESFNHLDGLIEHVRTVHTNPQFQRRWREPEIPVSVKIVDHCENFVLEASQKFIRKLNFMGLKNQKFKFRKISNILNFDVFNALNRKISNGQYFLLQFHFAYHFENFLPDSLGHFNFLKEFLTILCSEDDFISSLRHKLVELGFENKIINRMVNFAICLFPELHDIHLL